MHRFKLSCVKLIWQLVGAVSMPRHRISVTTLSPIRSPICHLWHTGLHVRSGHNALHPAKTDPCPCSEATLHPAKANPSTSSVMAQRFTRRKKSALSSHAFQACGAPCSVRAQRAASGESRPVSMFGQGATLHSTKEVGTQQSAVRSLGDVWGVRRAVWGVRNLSGSRLE